MEWDFICVTVDPEGVVSPRGVEEKNVQPSYGSDDEGDKEVKREKAGQRGIVHGKASS